MNKTTNKTNYQVRQIKRGYWTYDIYREGQPTEFSVGECYSRKHAEKCAQMAIEIQPEYDSFFNKIQPTQSDFLAAIGPCGK